MSGSRSDPPAPVESLPAEQSYDSAQESSRTTEPSSSADPSQVPSSTPPAVTGGQVRPAQAPPRRQRQSDTAVKFARRAGREDVTAKLKRQQREQEAYRVGLIRIRERGLPMKLTRVEQAPDGSRLVFYFTAEGRIDFRELVRELASEFRTRIEMRQIGVRDEARLLGGYGSCGRPLCCSIWLQGFEPVSIKMAKQQDLSLNPWKLSGLCGRLKCCLRYEMNDPRACGKTCPNGPNGRAEDDET